MSEAWNSALEWDVRVGFRSAVRACLGNSSGSRWNRKRTFKEPGRSLGRRDHGPSWGPWYLPSIFPSKKGHPVGCPDCALEARPGFEPGIKALQASALPLGHLAIYKAEMNRPREYMERATGFEPATSTLARWRATNCAKPAMRGILYASIRLDARTNFKKLFPGTRREPLPSALSHCKL